MYIIVYIQYFRGRGGIGRHDGLKIRCLVIVREGSSPSVPKRNVIPWTYIKAISKFLANLIAINTVY